MNGAAFRPRVSALTPLEIPVTVKRCEAMVRVMFHDLTPDDLDYLASISECREAWAWAMEFARRLAGSPAGPIG